MNEDIIQGKWEQVKGSVQKQWGKLTNDDMDKINGDRKKPRGPHPGSLWHQTGRSRKTAQGMGKEQQGS